MRKIVYTLPDGSISIVTPIRNTYPEPEELSDEDIEQRAWGKLPADAIDPHYVDQGEIPTDRTFRAAWKADLTVDMDKARAIQKQRMRDARAPLLASLDVEYQRADEAGDDVAKAEIIVRKQVLRDVTADPAIAAAKTPDDLKAVWPTCLGDQA